MTSEELKAILEAHKLWRESGGTQGSRANLSRANLTYANLSGADLGGANLTCANLTCANLGGADLGGANLGGANLTCANLGGAYLGGANLTDAYLGDANLAGAYLVGAYLGDANGKHIPLRHSNSGGSWHGEAGRTLLCVEIKDDLRFFCGCFRGTEAELREHIARGEARLQPSRLRALDRCLEDMAWGKAEESCKT